jgi:carboxymethylenebutenolidase
MSAMIHLTSAHDAAQIAAYETGDANTAKAAVVLLQEIFGVNAHIRKVADSYAALGYYVLAPDMFARVKSGVQLGYTPEDMPVAFALKAEAEKNVALLLQDVQAAVNQAAGANKRRKVGVVGYCWGGLLSWRAAQHLSGVAASAPYYGGGMHKELDLPLKCPVMAHLSDQDDYVPMAGVAQLQKAYPQAQVHIYAAKHGFNCDERASFNMTAKHEAFERTKAFFAQHLA